jgi:hypothetical protein
MSAIFTNILGSLPGIGLLFNQGWYPPNWAYGPQQVMITANVPTVNSTIQPESAQGLISDEEGNPIGGGSPGNILGSQNNTTSFAATNYFFDAVMTLHHEQRLRTTEHPVQNGAAISDHAFIQPARVTLEFEFSDAMASYGSTLSGAAQYTAYATKSQSAYQSFLSLRNLRIPIVLTTKLDTYTNMLIEELISDEDMRTRFAWKGRMVLKQIFTATAQTQTPNGRPNQLTQTSPGASTPQPVPQNIQNNYYDSDSGDWNSNPLEAAS